MEVKLLKFYNEMKQDVMNQVYILYHHVIRHSKFIP